MRREASVSSSSGDVRVGFVELIDAVPLVAAKELGYFVDEGLRVTLHRQIGWGNVRDKLIYGQLHASHALVGMPPVSILRRERFPEPVAALMSLGVGGNAITLGRRLTDIGVDSASALARHCRAGRLAKPPLLGHVFGCSMHHYLLREWLHGGGVDPDQDVRLCVLPPSQMPRQLEVGGIDGFCVGEPWNTLAEAAGLGRIIATTTDLLPDHPEKILAARHHWIIQNPGVAEGLTRATLRACIFCSDAANIEKISQVLSGSAYLSTSAQTLNRILTAGRLGVGAGRDAGLFGSCAPVHAFAAATHAVWILCQMIRWGQLPQETDVLDVAQRSVNSGPYRRAAASLKIECPSDDLPPMRLRAGWFDPKSAAALQSLRAGSSANSAFRTSAGASPAKAGV